MVIAPKGIDRFSERKAQLGSLLEQSGKAAPITLSCGQAGLKQDGLRDIWEIYRLADQRMYEHKQQMKKDLHSEGTRKRR